VTAEVDVDVLVVGGGPVGLGAGVMARAAGLTVAVLERRSEPVDKACGEGLMPSAVAALAALGVDPAGVPFAGIRYVSADGSRSATARFAHGAHGRGVRRTTLVAALAARADAVGVKRILGTYDGLAVDGERVTAAGVGARWLLGADGLHSTVRGHVLGEQVRPPSRPSRSAPRPRFGLRRHFAVEPWTDVVEVHWSEHAEAYVTPVGPAEVGVAVLTDVRGRGFDAWLPAFPDLCRRLGAAAATTDVLGAGPLEQVVPVHRRGRVLLVGDAAGYVDALTGEGVALGLATARAAVGCIAAGQPEAYEAQWRAATRRYRTLTRAVLFAAQHEPLRRAVVPAASALPPVFRAVVRALA
jgi:flavin-dependent dehydrogenase